MNIKPQVYDSLTPKQRIIASVDAMARGDEEEKQRLIKSCPKKSYKMNDPAYACRMGALQDMAVAVECDTRGLALDYLELLLSNKAPDNPKEKDLLPDTAAIEEMLSIREAWHGLLQHEGIEPATMDRAYNYLGHYSSRYFMKLGERLNLKPNPEIVDKYKDALNEYLELLE